MKKMNALTCLFFLSIIWGAKGAFTDSLTTVDEMMHKLLQLSTILDREFFSQWLNVYGASADEKYLRFIRHFKSLGDELDEKFLSDGFENLNALNSIWSWARTKNELKDINGLYNIFRQMQHEIIDQNAKLDLQKLADMSETILTDPNASIVRALQRVSDLIVRERLFVSAYQETSSQICYEQQSAQQLLFNLYTTVALTEIKGYAMIKFSYMLLRMYNQDANFTEEMQHVEQQYTTRISDTLRAVKTAMAFAPRDLWNCDPRVPKLDETYTQLTELFQGYIVNEVDLNGDNTCKENCAHYSLSKVHGCYKDQFCVQQRRCRGDIINCEFVQSDMWICPSDNRNNRRYEYIEYENGMRYGHSGSCQRETIKVDSWWRWLFWHCSYCFCYCDDHTPNSERYFSLREVVADVKNNKVVTGISLKKVNQIVHIEIQEGELLPRGNINRTSVRWKPIDAFNILDRNVLNGRDYHTLEWRKRGLDLDDLIPAQDHLLTGLRFRTIGTHLNLEIMVSPFNFTNGKLIKPVEKSYWLSNDVTERTELKLKNPDVPTRNSLPNMPDSKPNQYVNFAPSDRNTDAAQNTIPFLDIQRVEPNPPIPISGAGMFHKGRGNSGGYVAVKVITYDFTPHMHVDLPSAPPIINAPNEITVV